MNLIFLETIMNNLETYLLILVRIGAMFMIGPIFARREFPTLSKLWLSVFIGFIFIPAENIGSFQSTGLMHLVLNIINEFLIGIIIGFIGFTLISVMFLAGRMMDTQMGFGMVNVFEPQLNIQIPIMGSFHNMFMMLLFLILDGHLMLIKSIDYSLKVIPVGEGIIINQNFIYKITEIISEFFVLSFRFSAPVIGTVFLANAFLGILARTMPQMNVFVVGLPLKIIIGSLTVIVSLQFFVPFSEVLFDYMFESIRDMIHILNKG